jgi:hypothetical protein
MPAADSKLKSTVQANTQRQYCGRVIAAFWEVTFCPLVETLKLLRGTFFACCMDTGSMLLRYASSRRSISRHESTIFKPHVKIDKNTVYNTGRSKRLCAPDDYSIKNTQKYFK